MRHPQRIDEQQRGYHTRRYPKAITIVALGQVHRTKKMRTQQPKQQEADFVNGFQFTKLSQQVMGANEIANPDIDHSRHARLEAQGQLPHLIREDGSE